MAAQTGSPYAEARLSLHRRRVGCPWAALALVVASQTGACIDKPYTFVVLENDYPASSKTPLTIYGAYWESIFFPTSIPAGTSSTPQDAIPASGNTAYVVLAPGWSVDASAQPTSFIVLQSRSGLTVHLYDTLDIQVDDTTFEGNCAAGSFLTQAQADFITQIVFSSVFAGMHYDAATCTTTPVLAEGGS
jgi:hypothetical protein